MKKRILLTLLGSLLSNSSFGAIFTDPYLSIGGGYALTTSNSRSVVNSGSVIYAPTIPTVSIFNAPNVTWKNNYNNGFNADFALGTSFFKAMRVEGEFLFQNLNRAVTGSYDWQEINALSGDVFAPSFGNPITTASSYLSVYSLMANAYYDYKNCTHWIPSLGAGIGLAYIKSNGTNSAGNLVVNDLTVPESITVPTIQNSPSISTSTLAWQVKVGLAYEAERNWTVYGQYRLLGTSSFKTGGSSMITNPGTSAVGLFSIAGKNVRGLLDQGFELGLRYSFC